MPTRRVRRRLAGLALATSALLGVGAAMDAGPAGAIGFVDQQQAVADSSLTLMPGLAQTFTVGRSGSLDGISLMSPSGGRFLLQVYPLAADGTPDYTKPLLAYNVQANLLAGVQTDVALPGANVVAGQQLALAIGLQNPYYTTASLATGSGDPYAGGVLYSVPGIYTFNPVAGVDLEFATYVTSPAPSNLAVPTLSSTAGKPTATLTSNGQAVAGRTISFELRRSDGRVKDACSATTDATGKAVCAKARWSVPSGGSMVASFAGDAMYAPASASVSG